MLFKRLTKPRFVMVYPILAGLFGFARVTEASLRIGIALICAGEALRFWANGYVGNKKVNWTQKQRGDRNIGELTTAGPYAFVRHPLYFGTLILGAGFCLMVRNVWLSIAALAAFIIIYNRKVGQEEVLLEHECTDAYTHYQNAVARFIPRWPAYPHRHGRWTWKGIAASKEWKTGLWIVVLTILVYFWEESVQEHEWLFEEHPLFRFFLLG
ncbi:MAG: isoprenylcysteine carboxylmethyltransferase family protein, partial [Candidatus Omnitrophica bacterium]|nr:isoprenylcysteine carboxylmethyltransferase family protein [Candidatus Omnitrophota bacterium]